MCYGGRHCDAEMVRRPALVGAVKTEMVSQECRVRVGLIEISEFLEISGPQVKDFKASRGEWKAKAGKGGKDKKEGSVKGIR